MVECIPDDIRPHSLVLVETTNWLVGVPLNMHAMFWWGGFTEWCIARDAGWYSSYVERGSLIIFRASPSGGRWAFHAATGEFRDRNNRKAGWRSFLMRNPDISAALMRRLAEVQKPDPELLRPLLSGLVATAELARFAATDHRNVRMKLTEVQGAAEEALDWLNADLQGSG